MRLIDRLEEVLEGRQSREDLIRDLKAALKSWRDPDPHNPPPPLPMILNALEWVEGLDPEVEAILVWLARIHPPPVRFRWMDELFMLGWKHDELSKIDRRWGEWSRELWWKRWGWWEWQGLKEWVDFWLWDYFASEQPAWRWMEQLGWRCWVQWWPEWLLMMWRQQEWGERGWPVSARQILRNVNWGAPPFQAWFADVAAYSAWLLRHSCSRRLQLRIPHFVDIRILGTARFAFLAEFATRNGEPIRDRIPEEWIRAEEIYDQSQVKIQGMREELLGIAEEARKRLQSVSISPDEPPSVPREDLQKWVSIAGGIWETKRALIEREETLARATREFLPWLIEGGRLEFRRLWPDGVLGRYLPGERTIVIYAPMIQLTALSFRADPMAIYEIVLNHEIAHALIHTGEARGFPDWRDLPNSPFGLHEGLAHYMVQQVNRYPELLKRLEEKLPDLYTAASVLKEENPREMLKGWRESQWPRSPSALEELRRATQEALAIIAQHGGTFQSYSEAIRREQNLADLAEALAEIFEEARRHSGSVLPNDSQWRRWLFEAFLEQTDPIEKADLYILIEVLKSRGALDRSLESIKNGLVPSESAEELQRRKIEAQSEVEDKRNGEKQNGK